MDRDRDTTTIRVLHHVMAAVDSLDAKASALKRFDYVRSRYDRDRTRHKSGSYQKSGYVECHGQLTRWPDHIEQCLKRGAQVSDRLVWRRSITNCADARPDEGGSAPDAVLILLDGAGHVDVMSHLSIVHKLCLHMPTKFQAGTSRDDDTKTQKSRRALEIPTTSPGRSRCTTPRNPCDGATRAGRVRTTTWYCASASARRSTQPTSAPRSAASTSASTMSSSMTRATPTRSARRAVARPRRLAPAARITGTPTSIYHRRFLLLDRGEGSRLLSVLLQGGDELAEDRPASGASSGARAGGTVWAGDAGNFDGDDQWWLVSCTPYTAISSDQVCSGPVLTVQSVTRSEAVVLSLA